jgi:hypothetical protein
VIASELPDFHSASLHILWGGDLRRMFTSEQSGLSPAALRWGEGRQWRRVDRGVYAEGRAEPTPLERALAPVVRGATARGTVAGVLHGLDGVELRPEPRRRPTDRIVIIDGLACADGVQTLVDLAGVLDDERWEQALESALRKGLVTVDQLEDCRSKRIRRVLGLRPPDAPPTGSLLETLLVQLARRAGLPDPIRQLEVYDRHGRLVGRVDLAWPALGVFVELDGQQHKDQPVYDARRQTAVTAATRWRCGRFTWHEVVYLPTTTARRLAELLAY